MFLVETQPTVFGDHTAGISYRSVLSITFDSHSAEKKTFRLVVGSRQHLNYLNFFFLRMGELKCCFSTTSINHTAMRSPALARPQECWVCVCVGRCGQYLFCFLAFCILENVVFIASKDQVSKHKFPHRSPHAFHQNTVTQLKYC